MTLAPEVLATIDPSRPSPARIYDALLDGAHNFAVDRAVAARIRDLVPQIPAIVRANREFVGRAIRHAATAGVEQFLDLGCGIFNGRTVHQVARAVRPDARVVYVDLDPAAVLYGRDALGADPYAAVLSGDLQHPDVILADPRARGLLDLTRPVAVLMGAVLPYVPEGPVLDCALRAYREMAVPGSHLVISHSTRSAHERALSGIGDLYNRTGTPLVWRDAQRTAALFDGWQLAAPGLVYTPQWRPEPGDVPFGDPAASIMLAGVAVR